MNEQHRMIDRHVAELVVAHREKLDAALAALLPGCRLCLHLAPLASVPDDDISTMRVRHQYHCLAPDQHCDEPNRTEYGPA